MSESAVDSLRRATLFAGLTDDSLRRVAECVTEYEAPAGQVLIEPGMAGSGMFVVCGGSVVVETRSGRRVELGPGEVIGEMALIKPDGMRTARVRALTDVRCLTLDRQSFRRLLAEEPGLAVAVLDVVASRIQEEVAFPPGT